jgi:hypothetical protein
VLAFLVVLAAGAALAAADSSGGGYADFRGTYTGGVCIGGTLDACEASPEYPHTKTIANEDFTTGAISGPGYDGQITGCTMVFHVLDDGSGYTSTETETMSADGNTLTGSFSDSNGHSGPDFDYRTSGGPTTCPPKYLVSGTVYDQQCTEESCSQVGLGGIEMLVTGTAQDGTTVSATGTTAADGTWSASVPNGTYDVGPTTDGSTFVGPDFDPESNAAVVVNGQPVGDQNFSTCAVGTDSSTTSDSTGSLIDGKRAMVSARNSANYTASLCKSQYTLTLSADIPQKQIVDPSPNAPYNRSKSKGEATFPGGTSTAGILFYDHGLDSVFEEYPKYPGCEEIYGHTEGEVEHALEHLAEHKIKMRWYTYMSGGDLGKVTIPLVFNQSQGADGTVFYGASNPTETSGELTRVWKYQYVNDSKHPASKTYTCKAEAKISPMAIAVPGGGDKTGSVNDNAFTAIVLWYFPFDPSGEVTAPGASTEALLRRLVSTEKAKDIVETYEHMPWIAKFAFTADLATGAVKGIEGAVGVGKFVKATSGTLEALEKLASVGEKLHQFHTAVDVGKPGYEAIANLLTGDHYPVMGTVIRGVFKTTPNTQNQKLVYATSLGLTIDKTDFPDIKMSVVREAKSSTDSSCPQSGSPQTLGWAPNPTGCNRVWNPYGSQPSGMLSQANGSYTRGKDAVQAIVDATNPLEPLADAVRKTDDLWEAYPSIQNLVQPPNCDPDDGPQSQQSNTICWVFTDGRP